MSELPSVTTIICTCLQRERQAWKLHDATGAQGVQFDVGHGPTLNHAFSWEWGLREPTDWVVVLEDDALVGDDYARQVARALADAPSGVVSLYLGTGVPASKQAEIRRALAEPSDWYISTNVLSHVAVAARAHLVPGIVSALREYPNHACDQILDIHVRKVREPVAYLYPSLVDHADGPTTVDHVVSIDMPRVAHRFSPDYSPTYRGPQPLDRAAVKRLGGRYGWEVA